MNVNNTSNTFLEIPNSYQNAFSGALIEVALCHEKVKIIDVIDNSLGQEITDFLQTGFYFEESMILNQSIQRGEKYFTFEYTNKEDNQVFLIRAVYTDKQYQSEFAVFLLYIYDITEFKMEMESEKKNSNELDMYAESLSIGILKLSLEDGYPILWYNRSFAKNTGYTPEEFKNLYQNKYFDAPVDNDKESLSTLIEKCVNEETLKVGRITLHNKDGEPQLYEIRVLPVKPEQKNEDAVYCIISIMTGDMKREQELKSFEERYKMVLSFTSEIVLEYDVESDVMHYFGGESSTLKRPSQIKDFYKKVCSNTLPGGKLTEESVEEINRILSMFKVDKLESTESYICYQLGGNNTQWVYLVVKCIYSPQNEAMLVIGKLSDVTLHKEIEHNLMVKANTDYLTQVSSREYAQEEIQKYLIKNKIGLLAALFIIDVDNFKTINDLYGHLEGDAVLAKLSDILRNEFRSSDVIGRLGGDEFIVFMKDVKAVSFIYEKAETIVKTVRAKINNVTVSVGISLLTEKSSFEQLYKTADIALYQAKLRGKNTYVCYNDLSDDIKKLESCTSTGLDVIDMMDIIGKEDFNTIVCSDIAKTILESYNYIYIVNLTQNKTRRYNEEEFSGDEHNFKTYTEMFEHIKRELFDEDEKKDYVENFSRERLIELFISEERVIHRYIRVFTTKQEFHWYFMEAVLYENNIKGEIVCTIMFKDVQKIRSDEMRKYENKTRSHIIQKIEDEKTYDSLTGLYQANKFYDIAKDIIWSNVRKKYAVISFDVDSFRVINDIYSEEVGDQVICYIADVLRRLNLEDKVFCRYYADCFNMLIGYETRKGILELIDWIRDECAKTPYVNGTFKLSFGVYLVSDPSIPIRLMCDWARLAARPIKGLSNQYYAFYNEEYRKELVETQRIEAEMNRALENEEFKMYLQPKYNLRTNQVVGAEALVRWQHPKQGVMYPNRFIKLFEKNGFILKLDEYMWEQACKQLRKWLNRGIEYPISVNISRLHTYDPALVQKLLNLTSKYEIPVHLLELEFTEGLFMENVQMLYGLMYNLKKNGFVLQMDDFGSGYSSLNMLKSVPIDTIKLDKAFFEDISENPRGKIIIEDSIKMIHNLNLEVMAEGIETKEHVDFLNQCDCVIGQGYYYARPMSVKDFEALINY